MLYGRGPGMSFPAQLGEKFSRVGGVNLRVEGVFQRPERLGVVLQIDLHAANIDVFNTAAAQLADSPYSGAFGGKEPAFPFRGNGPRPGNICLFRFHVTA